MLLLPLRPGTDSALASEGAGLAAFHEGLEPPTAASRMEAEARIAPDSA